MRNICSLKFENLSLKTYHFCSNKSLKGSAGRQVCKYHWEAEKYLHLLFEYQTGFQLGGLVS